MLCILSRLSPWYQSGGGYIFTAPRDIWDHSDRLLSFATSILNSTTIHNVNYTLKWHYLLSSIVVGRRLWLVTPVSQPASCWVSQSLVSFKSTVRQVFTVVIRCDLFLLRLYIGQPANRHVYLITQHAVPPCMHACSCVLYAVLRRYACALGTVSALGVFRLWLVKRWGGCF